MNHYIFQMIKNTIQNVPGTQFVISLGDTLTTKSRQQHH